MFGSSAATSAFLNCVQSVPWLLPALDTPLLFKQREAVVVDHSLGWERNVMYA